MPIKMLNFTFAVPLTEILGLVATRSANMKIDVLGDDKPASVKALNGRQAVKLLEGPKKATPHTKGGPTRGKDANGNPITAIKVMLRAMAAKPTHTMTVDELRPLVTKSGLMASSATSQSFIMKKRGLIQRIGESKYRLTAQGLRECVKHGYKIASQEAPKKPAKAKKPAKQKKPVEPKQPVPVEVTTTTEESQNG